MGDAGHQSRTRTAFMYALLAGAGALVGNAVSPGRRGAAIGALAATGWEFAWWLRRLALRRSTYAAALAQAQTLGLPLVVVGSPDRGARNEMCGDLVVDIAEGPGSCPSYVQADITKRIPLPDDSAVIFIPYVLEYVSDYDAAVRELQRVAPGRVHHLRVEPWTATAYFYQGARRVVSSSLPSPRTRPSAMNTSLPAGARRLGPTAGRRG